jgi:hypothetical protein
MRINAAAGAYVAARLGKIAREPSKVRPNGIPTKRD